MAYENAPEGFVRVRMPRGKETIGMVEALLGANKLSIRCQDEKLRICRIPGRLKRSLWVREGNIVVVEPWELGGDEKGDIIYKYTNAQTSYLKRKGHLKALEDTEEF